MRLILVSGGGGAGVTTFAAATPVAAASRGVRTRLAAVVPARIADVLGPVDAWPSSLEVAFATAAGLRTDAAAALRWLRPALRRGELDEWTVEELASLPVVRGIVALLTAVEGNPDLAVVDAGPSDEALALLYGLCLDPARGGRAGAGSLTGLIAGAVAAQAFDLTRPDAAVREAGRRMAERVAALSSIVRDPAVCSLRAVVPGDSRSAGLIVDIRTFARLWGVGLDALVFRSAPDAVATTPEALVIPPCSSPPQGAAQLRALGDATYDGRWPEAQITEAHGPYIEMRETGADLVLPLPEQPASAFHVSRRGAELKIEAGRWRRTFSLPALLQSKHARRAWHDGRVFRIRFED